MTRITTRLIIPVVTGVLGGLWLIYGLLQYGWWGDNGPQSGFFPAIVGFLLLGTSVIGVLDSMNKERPRYVPASFHPTIAAIGMVLMSLLIGFFPSLFLFVLGWIKLYEKYPWLKSLLITVITVALFYGVFVLWLRVPFPEGLIMRAIQG